MNSISKDSSEWYPFVALGYQSYSFLPESKSLVMYKNKYMNMIIIIMLSIENLTKGWGSVDTRNNNKQKSGRDQTPNSANSKRIQLPNQFPHSILLKQQAKKENSTEELKEQKLVRRKKRCEVEKLHPPSIPRSTRRPNSK